MFACANFRLVPNHILAVTSLDISGTGYVNRSATKISTRDTSSAPPGSEKFTLAKKLFTRSSFRGHKLFVDFEHMF